MALTPEQITQRRLAREAASALKKVAKKRAKKARTKNANAVVKYQREEISRLESRPAHAKAKYNWNEIRDYYIQYPEQISLVKLAEHFGVNPNTLTVRAAREKWTSLRGIEQARMFKQRREQTYKKNYDEGIKFDEQSVGVAKIGMGIVAGRLAQLAAIFRANQSTHTDLIERLARGEPVSRSELKGVIDSNELLRLGQTAQLFQDIGRKALHIDDETLNLNVTGTVDVEHVVNVGAELARGDKDRLASVIGVLDRIGITTINPDSLPLEEEVDIEEAEVIFHDKQKEIES